jgi:hypothetical protein
VSGNKRKRQVDTKRFKKPSVLDKMNSSVYAKNVKKPSN